MTVTFLGTGTSQGVPLIGCRCPVCLSRNPKDKRLRSAIMIESEGIRLVIDSGPDFRQQMLREKVSKITALILTHSHMDHIAGLDEVRAFNFIQKKYVDVYAEEFVQTVLKINFRYIFDGTDYPGLPKIKLHTIENKPFAINGFGIIPVRVFHYKLPVLGFRVGDFTYITDANYISDTELKKVMGSRIVVVNALRKRKHISHFTLKQAINLLQKINPEKGYLTHISHQLGLHRDIEKELPSFIKPAFDRLKISL
ncbi:MAG: MBL fold metallo-hydrolase [Bacteroidetes bacterium]|nr:MBL fold metallo-hydrolase [Bacteroidota bacterium]